MSASISHRELCRAVKRGERPPLDAVREFGEQNPGEFFRLVESLADSFDPKLAETYEYLMRAWIPPEPRITPEIPSRVDTVFVLSRVTLGADIKITSIVLDAMKRRFPESSIVLVGNRKSDQLFFTDPRISQLIADYPRAGSPSERIQFAYDLRGRLDASHVIVVDPDSRMTQLGLIPVCEPGHYFHFPSRTADWASNLTDLTEKWVQNVFGTGGRAYIAPEPVCSEGEAALVTVSLGVGDNESKRIPGDFESRLIQTLGAKFQTIWLDRGAGGQEAKRATAAGEASGLGDRVRFWEGSFAGFASLISQSGLYVGYDSAGQHAAAACGTPVISIFAGAPSARFRERWSPKGAGRVHVVDCEGMTSAAVLEQFDHALAALL